MDYLWITLPSSCFLVNFNLQKFKSVISCVFEEYSFIALSTQLRFVSASIPLSNILCQCLYCKAWDEMIKTNYRLSIIFFGFFS